MSKIIERLRREKNVPSKMQIAYAISISEIYLCPNNQSIQINEGNVKQKIIKNLVSFNFNFT
jgi:aspartate carbamoyltransferase regulatory subunit